MDHRPKRRFFVLAALEDDAAVRLPDVSGYEAPFDRVFAAPVHEHAGLFRRQRQRVDVFEIGSVVRLHIPEAIVEACAEDRDADERGAVEVHPAGHGDVRLPIERGPAQVRIPEQDGTA